MAVARQVVAGDLSRAAQARSSAASASTGLPVAHLGRTMTSEDVRQLEQRQIRVILLDANVLVALLVEE